MIPIDPIAILLECHELLLHRRHTIGRSRLNSRTITIIVPPSRLKRRRRRLQLALKDVIRDSNSQRHSTNREKARPIGARAQGLVPHILRGFVVGSTVLSNSSGSQHVPRGKGVKAPVDAEEDAADRGVVHGIPKAGEFARNAGTDCAGLISDGDIGIIWVAEIAAYAVELFGHKFEGDVIRRIVGEGKVVSFFVIEAGGLEASASKRGMAGWILASISQGTE